MPYIHYVAVIKTGVHPGEKLLLHLYGFVLANYEEYPVGGCDLGGFDLPCISCLPVEIGDNKTRP